MTTRSVKYGSISQGTDSSGVFYSAATTWGELKSEEPKLDALSHGMSALLRQGSVKIALTSDSDSLPEGDITITFVTDKNNSGKNIN
jgi:adenine deaminase